jgi:hypothetical protein
MTTPHQPAGESSDGKSGEPLVEDLLDETRGPEEDAPTDASGDAKLRREEITDDLKPRD